MISVNICAASILWVCDLCACVLQVRRSRPCSGSCNWQQAHAPDGAPALPGHSVRSGSVCRKILTSWSAPIALLAASQIEPECQVGSSSPHQQHFALTFYSGYLNISDTWYLRVQRTMTYWYLTSLPWKLYAHSGGCYSTQDTQVENI